MGKLMALCFFLALQLYQEAAAKFYDGDDRIIASYSTLLKAGCPTARAFCNSIVTGAVKPATTYLKTINTVSVDYTYTAARTTTITAPTRTITLTTTVADSTKSIRQCLPTTMCGAAEFHLPDVLTKACESVLKSTVTKSVTRIENYEATVTSKQTKHEKTVKTTPTRYVIHTETATTVTARHCVTALPPPMCNNKGYELAVFDLTQDDIDSELNPWNIDSYKTMQPIRNYTEEKDTIGPFTSSFKDVFDYGYDECLDHFYNFRTYLYAPQTGKYTFTVPEVILAAYAWIGDVAVTEYNQTNAFLQPSGADSEAYSASVNLVRGNYYPFRVGQSCTGGDVSDFYMNIEQPDGGIMEGQYDRGKNPYFAQFEEFTEENGGYGNIKTNYFARFGCGEDKHLAPVFADWGSEV